MNDRGNSSNSIINYLKDIIEGISRKLRNIKAGYTHTEEINADRTIEIVELRFTEYPIGFSPFSVGEMKKPRRCLSVNRYRRVPLTY